MTLKDLIDLSGDRDLSKSYPKADGVYIWDYKILLNEATKDNELHLIPSDSGKAGYKDKVSLQELMNYVLDESDPQLPGDELTNMLIVGVEGITVARI
jgi:hypothetical protein